jgi:hypothetical protein
VSAKCDYGGCDGVFRWSLFRVEPVRNETDEVVRWYGSATDIDQLKRTEWLRSAEKRTLEMVADGASIKDILNEQRTVLFHWR